MKWWQGASLFISAAVASNLLATTALPRLINGYVSHQIVKRALANPSSGIRVGMTPQEAQRYAATVAQRGGVNVALPAARADANARAVVRPSPDLLYTACVFNVSRKPLLISAPVPEGYLSISGFSADTSNFFSINNTEASAAEDGSRKIEFVLARAGETTLPAGVRVVTTPSDTGLILFRLLVTDDAGLPRLQAEFQDRQACNPL